MIWHFIIAIVSFLTRTCVCKAESNSKALIGNFCLQMHKDHAALQEDHYIHVLQALWHRLCQKFAEKFAHPLNKVGSTFINAHITKCVLHGNSKIAGGRCVAFSLLAGRQNVYRL